MFDFLSKWMQGKMSRADKDRYFSGFTCHELHLFLKKHDPDYFREVVQPFVASKMEKTFIDHYILEDYEWVVEQTDIGNFEGGLNALEQALAVEVLMETGDEELANKLAEVMELRAKYLD